MKNIVITLLLIFTIDRLIAETHFNHPFYVSIIQINHNLDAPCLELTFKIFTDDLEIGISGDTGNMINLSHFNENKKADSIISDYVKNHFKLKISGKTSSLEFVGLKSTFDVTEVYFTIQLAKAHIESMEINCDLLVNEIPKQTNILHYQIRDKTRSLILDINNIRGKIKP